MSFLRDPSAANTEADAKKEEQVEVYTTHYLLNRPDDKCWDNDQKIANAAKQQYFETVAKTLTQQKGEINYYLLEDCNILYPRPYVIRLCVNHRKLTNTTSRTIQLKKDASIDPNDISQIELPITMHEKLTRVPAAYTVRNPAVSFTSKEKQPFQYTLP